MLDVSMWELAASGAGMLFNMSFISQVMLTLKTRDVAGLSASQWMGFTMGTCVFIGFYANLHQWLMVSVSLVGLLCTMTMLCLIYKYKGVQNESRV